MAAGRHPPLQRDTRLFQLPSGPERRAPSPRACGWPKSGCSIACVLVPVCPPQLPSRRCHCVHVSLQAEQSLKSVEKTLHDHWGLGRPAWLDAAYYARLLEA